MFTYQSSTKKNETHITESALNAYLAPLANLINKCATTEELTQVQTAFNSTAVVLNTRLGEIEGSLETVATTEDLNTLTNSLNDLSQSCVSIENFTAFNGLLVNTCVDLACKLAHPEYTAKVAELAYVSDPVKYKFVKCKNKTEIQAVEGGAALLNGSTIRNDAYLLSLEDGENMFNNRLGGQSLNSFGASLPSLTNGNDMFYQCGLTRFTGEVPNLTTGQRMFESCPLTSCSVLFPQLVEGNAMFNYCSNMESFTSPLPKLTVGIDMFAFCSKLAAFNTSLPLLEDGQWMFYACNGLTSFNGDMPNLKNGKYMFYNSYNIESFKGDLSSLEDATKMFYFTGLSTFTLPMPNLENAFRMFYRSNMKVLSSSLPKLVDGSYMLTESYKLTSFVAVLPSLEIGTGMFLYCSGLTSFSPFGMNADGTPKDTGAAGVLQNAMNMFNRCKLDLASVKRIAGWLPTRTDSRPTGFESTNGWIHIGVDVGVNTQTEFHQSLAKMLNKNWSVVVCVTDNPDNPTSYTDGITI